MSAPIYSRRALVEARVVEREQAGAAPEEKTIFDLVPLDAPMPEALILGYWADWLGEFVSRDRYLASMPIDRVRGPIVPPAPEAPIAHRQTVVAHEEFLFSDFK